MNYRRSKMVNASYFFTVNLANRSSQLLIEQIHILREAFRRVKSEHPFEIEAIVVLPEHLHTLWRLPDNDADYSTRWMLIKSAFSRQIQKNETIRPSRQRQGERGIWQRRYWEHTIRDEKDWQRHFDYIHYNPVKHGWVAKAVDWQYSSFHRYVRLGWLSPDWGCADSSPVIQSPSFSCGE